MIGAGNDKQYRLLAEKILLQPALADDPRFSSNGARVKNRAELIQIITNVLEQHNRDHWIKQFTGLGVPFGPINNIQETFEHPQAIARGAIIEIDHPRAGRLKLVAPAVTYDGKRMPVTRPPPYLSEHTSEVLSELEYTTEEIARLRQDKVI